MNSFKDAVDKMSNPFESSFLGKQVDKVNFYSDGYDAPLAKELKMDIMEKQGGSYKEVREGSEGETHEIHHMPADSVSFLERNDGPAIKMEKADHRQTESCGSSREAREYRAQQKELIDQGKFREAIQMDIDDIHYKFGNKYDGAVEEMLIYVDKLEQEGKLDV